MITPEKDVLFYDLTEEEKARIRPAGEVMLCLRGSHSHGTYIPPEDSNGFDDVDVMSVYIDPRPTVYFGIDGQVWSGKDVKIKQWDSVSYCLQHFAKLCAGSNPNVLSALWLKSTDYVSVRRPFRRLFNARDMFSSKLAAKAFGGYAYSQLKRMTAWKDQEAAGCGCAGEFHVLDCPLRQERGRGSEKLYATGFMGEKRKSLVEKYGYDVKNAAHLIRLLRMGAEFLQDGVLRVDRTGIDANELIEIKTGLWPIEKVQAQATNWYEALDESAASSPLPETPNFVEINLLVTSIVQEALAGR